MRSGSDVDPAGGSSPLDSLPRSRRRLLLSSVFVGVIALFPQALVPAAMKLSGEVARVWFIALYLPDGWQWPTIVFMFALGFSALALAGRLYAQARVRHANAG